MSIGLMFDDITMNMVRNKSSGCHVELIDTYFTKIENNYIYVYRGSLQEIYWRKGAHEIPDIIYQNFNVERIKVRQYLPLKVIHKETSLSSINVKISNSRSENNIMS